MDNILKEANRIRSQKGLKTLLFRGCGFAYRNTLRHLLPITGNAVWNGVRMPQEVSNPRHWLDEYLPTPFHYSIRPDAEGGEIKAHRNFTKPGDTVVIIGGGRGVSAVVAAEEAGDLGSVTVFEGSPEYAEVVRETCRINNCSEICSVREQVVGPGINVYGEEEQSISPEDIPECDILELDCEGAEKEILEGLNIRPRVLIVEVHPIHFQNSPIDTVLTTMGSLGYDISTYMTNQGRIIDRETFIEELDLNREKNGPSPVVVATKSE